MTVEPLAKIGVNNSCLQESQNFATDSMDILRVAHKKGGPLLPTCNLLNWFNWWNFLKQMLSENNKVLDIDYAVAPGHRANITQWLICMPVIKHYTDVRTVHLSVPGKVNDGSD